MLGVKPELYIGYITFYNKSICKNLHLPIQGGRREGKKKPNKNNKGISKRGNKWRVNISVNGKAYYLGTAGTLEEATKLRNTVLEQVESGTFEDWYNDYKGNKRWQKNLISQRQRR